MRLIETQVIIDFVPDSSLKPVFGFCRSVRSTFSLTVLFLSPSAHLRSQLCLCLLAAVNVHRHADPPPATCLFLLCCFHLCITALAGSNIFNTRNTFSRLLLFKHGVCVFVCVCKFKCELPKMLRFSNFSRGCGGAFYFPPVYFHTFVPFLLWRVFQGVKAGSTMVPVWASTMAFMNGSERGGSDGEREATGSSLLCSLLSFIFDVTHFIYPCSFPFYLPL